MAVEAVLCCNILFHACHIAGELLTTASWIRKFVTSHPDYKQDSVVSEKVTYDLYKEAKMISNREKLCPELTGNLVSKAPNKYKVLDRDCQLEPTN